MSFWGEKSYFKNIDVLKRIVWKWEYSTQSPLYVIQDFASKWREKTCKIKSLVGLLAYVEKIISIYNKYLSWNKLNQACTKAKRRQNFDIRIFWIKIFNGSIFSNELHASFLAFSVHLSIPYGMSLKWQTSWRCKVLPRSGIASLCSTVAYSGTFSLTPIPFIQIIDATRLHYRC